MAKTLKEAAVTTRNARAKLPSGVHWKGLDPEVHLGYRKGKSRPGGVWLVRWRHGVGYRQKPLGTADDELSEGTLDYEAARRAARSLVEAERAATKAAAAGPILTVRGVVENYIATRDARDSRRRGREVRSDAGQRLKKHVLSAPVADITLYTLKETDLATWRAGLPAALKVTTRRRLTNDFRSALNIAFAANRENLPASLPAAVKYGLRAEPIDADEALPVARENQILSDSQVRALIVAADAIDDEQGWEGDFYRLVLLLAATGARFSQAARLRVGDVQRAQSRILVPTLRKGRAGAKLSATPVQVGEDVLNALVPVITGRAPGDWLLERWRKRQVPGSIRQWKKASRGAWETASEMVGPWHALRDRAGLPGVIPYSLRHSSIVRGLRSNLSVSHVALLHDTSAQMIHKHYGAHIAEGLEELAARAVVPMVSGEGSNVVPIRGRSPAL